MKYPALVIKRKIESALMQPLIWMGQLAVLLSGRRTRYKRVYFFPFYHIGGAEKLHYQIAQSTGDSSCIIYFTRKSQTKDFLKEFQHSGCRIKDISAFTDNKFLYFLNIFYRGYLSAQLNRQAEPPLVFNGQSNFGYKISPWLNPRIPQVELIHALNTFSLIRLPFINFYQVSLTVSQEIVDKHKALYWQRNVPHYLWKRFRYIASRIVLPAEKQARTDYSAEPLVVLYVGRATPEKRPQLISAIAAGLKQKNLDIRFEFAGDVRSAIPEQDQEYCYFHGDVHTEPLLDEIYRRAHILAIPSSTESGPLVLMEAMARGVAIISTPVGIAPLHIQHGISGFLSKEIHETEKVKQEFAAYIEQLYYHRDLLQSIGDYNLEYAYQHFGIEGMYSEYRAIFASLTHGLETT